MSQLKIYLPPPANWQDFQSLVTDIARSRYDPRTVTEYGRSGQRQDGIDVYAEDYLGNKIGLQCKQIKDGLSETVVRAEADKAVNFSSQLHLFIVATTAERDARLQDQIFALNQSAVYRFKLKVDFWNDLIDDINRYANVLNDCYKSYRDSFQRTDEDNHLACLRVAFDRPAFRDDFLHERNYDDFEEALVTTIRLFSTGFTSDRWSQIPVVQTVPIVFLPDGAYRTFAAQIENKLNKLYRTFVRDKSRIVGDPAYANNRAGEYNIQRGSLLAALNRRLRDANISEICINYV
jgi:hypothetical protein